MTWQIKDKVCIITGASSGIGEAAAVELARKGAILGLMVRDKERGNATLKKIKQKTGNNNASLHLADLKSQKQVHCVAEECLKQYKRIDVLINNAGFVANERSITEDGIETVFAVNHLSHFLLTNLLLDRIKASAPARIINVASSAFVFGRLDFNDIDTSKGKYKNFQVYGTSKLATVLFTRKLARQLEGTGVTANFLHPGIVATRFGQDLSPGQKLMGIFMLPMLRGTKKGSQTTIYLATSPEVENITGEYFTSCKQRKAVHKDLNEDNEEKLWQISIDMIKDNL